MITEILVILAITIIVKVLRTKHERVLGIYSQPGPFYWIKWICFYLLYRWRTSRISKQDAQYDDGSDLRYLEDDNELTKNASSEIDVGVGKHQNLGQNRMERTQPVADSPFAIDAVYFNAYEDNVNSVVDGVTVVMGFTMRYRNYAEILFLVNIPGVGLLQHPSHPDRIICDASSDDYAYHGQGISIEMLEPMRRWKIKYNGFMRLRNSEEHDADESTDQSGRLIHVKFSLIWRSYSPVIEFDTDISASCMANAFASEEWSREFFNNIQKYHSHQTHYEQWGQMRGLIQVEEEEPREVLLRGLRDHSFSKRDWRHFHRYIIFMIHLDDGTSINATCICMDVTISRLTLGYIIHPNLRKESVTNVDLELWKHGEDGSIPGEITFKFKAGNRQYSVLCQIRKKTKYYCGFEWEGRVHETLADYHVNGVKGHGIAEFYYRHNGDKRSMADCPKSTAKRYDVSDEDNRKLNDLTLLKFEDSLCARDSLVGGKGTQLAILTQWSCESEKFIVPRGFCVTTSAYKRHVQANKSIQAQLNELDKISSHSDKMIKDFCERILELFEKSDMDQSLSEAIEIYYRGLDENMKVPVAVRSSAVGEDSADLSAAGQLDTFLGVSGLQEVLKALKKCWACQYSYSALQYRRQHGQLVLSTMGVVIQVMAEKPQVSGVLFTQHPVTGNPAHILINSNYGLGETVVSGSAEPDTIVVFNSPNNNPEIISKKVGSKAEKMVVKDSGDVETLELSPEESNKLSLSDKQIFQLVDIGKIIQANFASPRDIEWAISAEGKINLLQARPITNDPTETEFELQHEFDSAFSSKNYMLTTANIGEMMTGAVTPLTGSVFFRGIEYATQDFFDKGSPRNLFNRNDVYMSQSFGHLFMNYTEMTRLHSKTVFGSQKESIDLVLFGSVCEKLSTEDSGKYHDNCHSLPGRVWNAIRFGKSMNDATKEFVKLVEEVENLRLEGENSKDLYKVISENLTPYYVEGWIKYLMYAAASGVSSSVFMRVLSGGKLKWEIEHFSDLAVILSSCENVVSADAPCLLRKTAKHIFESGEKDTFIDMSPKDAIDWLIKSKSEAGDSFRFFLKNCGHRCIREAEFREKSWADDPVKLGISLQTAVKNYVTEPDKHYMSTEEVIKKLRTPVSSFVRFLLKWAIPRARKSVGGREWGKSKAVDICDRFKKAYWTLSSMMEKEEYLPDGDLMFFLTHGEIGKLLRTRSAQLVTRALRRRRAHGHAQELLFDDFSERIPISPISQDNDIVEEERNGLKLTGFPVSHGVVKGTARVALSLEHANQIKQGDILIVRTTDVGWSPYFPLISGLVTEIGGLISHGAVVAREYGLPCVVSAKKATILFKTGDYIMIDGGKGIIQKLSSE
uniref:putative phosphoenolpyruvate synthase isoform X1 n=1 Tax=Styela clava TaxID=7725 RepID=UPI00193A330A|nr:putative phosphoenolpyruvate synthase isoform X1 [Styela clava]